MAAGQRLMEVVRLFEGDSRVRVVFTAPPAAEAGRAVRRFLSSVGAMTVPWQYALEYPFELVVATDCHAVDGLSCPIVLVPHVARPVTTSKASAVALAHTEQWGWLGCQTADEEQKAEIVGDPEFDRLIASLPYRDAYRWALRVLPRQRLVVVASTLAAAPLLSCAPELPAHLVAELPRDAYRIALLADPDMLQLPGRHQVLSRLTGAIRDGLRVVSEESDWCAVLAAADVVIGDCGPASLYATAVGIPIVLAAEPPDDALCDGSPMADLAALAPHISAREPLARQMACLTPGFPRVDYSRVAARITSAPGAFARNMCDLIYRRLDIPRPICEPVTYPAPPPTLACR
ncbi:MAG TPA: hypothetical protein VFU73_03860 [Actinocrinis sp.]|nr:hypothetical protein [Actinocrinis sp.]